MAREEFRVELTADNEISKEAKKAKADLDRIPDKIETTIDADTSGLDGITDKLGGLPGQLGEVGGALGSMAGPAALGGIAVAMFETANAAKDLALEAKTTADLTGSTVEDASKLQKLWGPTGADVNDLNDVLLQMNGALAQSPELASQLGINLNDGKDVTQRFVELTDKLAAGQLTAVQASQLFGEEGVRQVGKLRTVYGGLSDDLENMPPPVDDAAVEKALEMERAMNELKATMQSIVTAVGQDLMGVFTEAAEAANNLVDALPGEAEGAKGLAEGYMEWATGLGIIEKGLSGLNSLLGDNEEEASKSVDVWGAFGRAMGDAVDFAKDAADGQGEYADAVAETRSELEGQVDAIYDAMAAEEELANARRAQADSGIAARDAQRDFMQQLVDSQAVLDDSESTLYDVAAAMDEAATLSRQERRRPSPDGDRHVRRGRQGCIGHQQAVVVATVDADVGQDGTRPAARRDRQLHRHRERHPPGESVGDPRRPGLRHDRGRIRSHRRGGGNPQGVHQRLPRQRPTDRIHPELARPQPGRHDLCADRRGRLHRRRRRWGRWRRSRPVGDAVCRSAGRSGCRPRGCQLTGDPHQPSRRRHRRPVRGATHRHPCRPWRHPSRWCPAGPRRGRLMPPPLIANTPPGVTPVVEIGVGDRYDASGVAALWGTARWSTAGDDNEWGGREPLWHDVTCDVVDVSTFAGRSGSTEPFDVGTATIVVRNLDGWADYKPPETVDNLLTVRPGRQVRVGVSIGGEWVPGVEPPIDPPPATFPIIAGSNTEFGANLSAGNAIPSPASVAAGDLLVIVVAQDTNSATVTASTGWTEVVQLNASTACRMAVFARVADGGANDALALTGAAADYCASIHRITDHGVTAIADIKSASATNTSGPADPPSVDAGSSKKWLWLAAATVDMIQTADAITAPMPTNYAEISNLRSAVSTSSVGLVVAQRDNETQTENPATFTHTGSRSWVAVTIAIPPPAAAARAVPDVWVPSPPVWLWRGTVDTTEPGYAPDEGDIVTLGCVDAKGDAGRADMPQMLTPVGGGRPPINGSPASSTVLVGRRGGVPPTSTTSRWAAPGSVRR